MITSHGKFSQTETGRFVNEGGTDWANYANSRCRFDERGAPLELPGTNFYIIHEGAVVLGAADPTMLVPSGGMEVVETDATVAIGSSFVDGAFGPQQRKFPPMQKADFWLAALKLGITEDKVSAEIDKLPGDEAEKARIEMRYRASFERNHPLLGLLSSKLGLTGEQIDGMWPSA
ncbi:hypothetical protein [Aureimonas ureilytica]|uniref:hypothetical protein n=1 Tax=Aureimonas ureilytica TaxID=401562 RepID=UPI000734FF0E|nr:hypothetical protein [Aureimonas ureilytica]